MNSCSLYIHIPFCISKCIYCDFFSVTELQENQCIPEKYIDSLCNEILYRASNYKIEKWTTVYIGGGTPSLLKINQLHKIFAAIKKAAILDSEAEVTMEVNPDDVSENFLTGCIQEGINRISCGIQTLNCESLSFCKRRASLNQNLNALDILAKSKINFSVDLICGLPEENRESFFSTLNKVIEFNPDHISMYSLTIEENTPLGKMYATGHLEYDFDFSDDLWLESREYLAANSYYQYEVSNFAKKDLKNHECAHNLVYWNHKSYLGCGSGATGTVYTSDGAGFRWTNTTNISEYTSFWLDSVKTSNSSFPQTSEEIDCNVSKYEFFMMGMRKLAGITCIEYESAFNEKLPESFVKLCKDWQKRKLLEIKPLSDGDTIYALNEKGILFLNSFLERLEIN